jgi:flavin-binding protein dodecin
MEPTYQKFEIVGSSEISFGNISYNAAAKASESPQPINWLAIAEQCMSLSRMLTYRRGKLNGTNLQED